MSLGQSTLAILALVVITFLVVSANRIIIQSQLDELKGEAYNQAGEIASELINEALKTKFDDPAVTKYIWVGYWKSYKLYDFYQTVSDFTSPSSLGPTTSVGYAGHPDKYPYKSIGYDDFDDYNGYQRVVDTPVMTGFVVNCTVSYLKSDALTPASNPTYTKQLVIKVSQPMYLPDTLYFSTTKTY